MPQRIAERVSERGVAELIERLHLALTRVSHLCRRSSCAFQPARSSSTRLVCSDRLIGFPPHLPR